jgi:hypothetical protein
MNGCCQGQRAGRCRVVLRAVRVICPGTLSSRRRRVLATCRGGVRLSDPTNRGGGAEELGPADQVVREGGGQQPGGVGVEHPRGAVHQTRAVLEVTDRQLDHGVCAVVDVELDHVAVAVGHERVVAPGVEQCR